MTETRKLAAILAADVAGYSKLAGSEEDRALVRLRALRSDLIDPTVARARQFSFQLKAGVNHNSKISSRNFVERFDRLIVTPGLGKRNKRACVWTISFPHRVVGIALQVHRTGFPIGATRAASHDLVERVALGRVEIETQHGHPAVE